MELKFDKKFIDEAVQEVVKDIKQNYIPKEVLNEIEEEINSPNRGACDYFIVDRIEEIINKYKAESEE